MDHIILVRKAHIPNFRPLVPSLHVKKFVVGGGWVGVKTWILVLSFKPKLNNFPMYIYKNLFLFYNLDFRIVSFIKKKEKRERYIFQISKASIKF